MKAIESSENQQLRHQLAGLLSKLAFLNCALDRQHARALSGVHPWCPL